MASEVENIGGNVEILYIFLEECFFVDILITRLNDEA